MKYIIIGILSIGVLAVLIAMFKSKHFMRSLLVTAFQGIASMLAVNVIGLVSGVTIALNWYTLSAVGLFGMPGCIALTIIRLIMQ